MHDHSGFQRDINDVTGVSLSLSLSLYYYSQKSLTHNIGSASALPIISTLEKTESYCEKARPRRMQTRQSWKETFGTSQTTYT